MDHTQASSGLVHPTAVALLPAGVFHFSDSCTLIISISQRRSFGIFLSYERPFVSRKEIVCTTIVGFGRNIDQRRYRSLLSSHTPAKPRSARLTPLTAVGPSKAHGTILAIAGAANYPVHTYTPFPCSYPRAEGALCLCTHDVCAEEFRAFSLLILHAVPVTERYFHTVKLGAITLSYACTVTHLPRSNSGMEG